MTGPLGLEALEAQVRKDLEQTRYPRRSWVPRRETVRGEPVLDVLVIGAGQGGCAVGAGLLLEKVDNILVVDRSDEDRAGPWTTFARMHTLRTPKHVIGPDLGLPSLTYQSWFEAQHGEGSWDRVGLIPKESWNAYLGWVRRMFGVPVRWRVEAGALHWDAASRCWAVPLRERDGVESPVYARHVVLATGIEGSGDWDVPDSLKKALPKSQWAHTREEIDFEALAGKRIAVLGAGASAFDNASVALEAGAKEVHVFFRRNRMVTVNPYRWAEFVGFLKHHGDLSDEARWRFILQILRMGQLPPADTWARARQHTGFRLHPGEPWESLTSDGDVVMLATPKGTYEVDFVIVGTGFVTDLSRRPELSEIHEKICLWRHRYAPPAGAESEDLARHPYLGPHFELTPRDAADAYLATVHNYTFGCLLSLGFGGASISGMKYSVPRLVRGVTGALYREDQETFYDSLCAFDEQELAE